MKKYVIPKGKHKEFRFPHFIWNKRAIKLTFKFDSSAIYTSQDPINQFDWNKLMGYSRGNHNKDSIRLGWRWNPETEKIELSRYRYFKGKRIDTKFDEVSIGEVKTVTLRLITGCKFGYMLFPYFGGDEVAPHDITIKIDYELS